jgi:hypothetical protein
MSVLVGLPYHPRKRYANQYVMDWVENQTHKDVEVVMRWHMGTFGEPDAVKTQREFFRKLAVERGHDHFYSMGTDTIPPLDVLDKLLAHNKDVVGAVYRQRKETEKPNVIAWRKGDEKQTFMNEGPLVKIDGMGMDSVLFSRKAFTKFTYFDWTYPDDDYPVYDILKGKSYDIWLDTTQICKHYMTKEHYV